jgi:hypothetical protein
MTAVLLLGFNRPWAAKKLASQVSQFGDAHFYVAIDGPRPRVSGEGHLVSETIREFTYGLRGAKVEALIREENLGCGKAVASALDWFFAQEPEGVVLEDDCIPTKEFWDYSRIMLDYFRDNHEIAAISGVNYVPPALIGDRIAYVSRFPLLWGWATWRRCWEGYSLDRVWSAAEMSSSPQWGLMGRLERRDWAKMFTGAAVPPHHTWDYQFVRQAWSRGQWTITPGTSLIRNIGLEAGAHASGGPSWWYRDPDQQILSQWRSKLDCTEPSQIRPLPTADQWWSRNVTSPPLGHRLRRRFGRLGH